MSKMSKLCNQLRLQYVKRWHVVHQTHDQSVAEHSFNTALIARRLAILCGENNNSVNEVMAYAMFHDMDEVLTGDIPGPFKETLPKELFRDRTFDMVDDRVVMIIKMADMMETTWHAMVHSVTPHAAQVADNCKTALADAIESCSWDLLTDASHTVWGEILHGEYDFV